MVYSNVLNFVANCLLIRIDFIIKSAVLDYRYNIISIIVVWRLIKVRINIRRKGCLSFHFNFLMKSVKFATHQTYCTRKPRNNKHKRSS